MRWLRVSGSQCLPGRSASPAEVPPLSVCLSVCTWDWQRPAVRGKHAARPRAELREIECSDPHTTVPRFPPLSVPAVRRLGVNTGRVTTQTCGGRPRGGNNARVTTKRATRTMRSAQLAIVALSTFALTRWLDTFVLSGRPVQREPAEAVFSRSALKCMNLRSFIGQH